MRTKRSQGPGRPPYPAMVLLLLPLLLGLPAAVELLSDFGGKDLAEAFLNCRNALSSWTFWASLAAFAFVILLYLKPVMVFHCNCESGAPGACTGANLAIRRINGLYGFIIGFSVVAFIGAELASQVREGTTFVTIAKRFMIFNAVSKGLLTGVILSFNLDNILFAAKKTAIALNPAVRLRRTSLFGKLSLIIAAIVLYLLFQLLFFSTQFFELGSDFMKSATGISSVDSFFARLHEAPVIKNALRVMVVKIVFYLFFVLQLVFQIKLIILNPIRTIKNRLSILNAGDAAHARAVAILSNDEFTDALREVNILIARQQEELESSSHRLEKIVEQAADQIVSFDGDGRILTFNPAAQAFFGYSAEEAKALVISALLEPAGGAAANCAVCETSAELGEYLFGEGDGIMRLTGVSRDGRRMIVESNLSHAESGETTIHTAILRDVSKQLEIERALTDAKTAAENANRLKSEFLANMSHELRTPLNAVLGFTQLLSNDRNLTDGQKEKIGIVSRSGEHLLSLINDILDISKIEAGKTELHETVFSLPVFVDDIRDMFSLRCQKAGLNLYVEFASPVPERVRGDLGKLRQVLINLVGNAVKFTREGGIGITVGQDGDLIRFSVTDSGRGIPAGELELIMQPFIQSSLNDNEGGTGLGLAISSRYIQMMGGSLSVTSAVGEGSTFAFAVRLPETGEELPGSGDEPVAIAVKQGTEVTALIVDDKELNRLVLKEMLMTAGFSTIEASNGQEAVDRARELRPSVVFMDIKMPVMDGFGAVALLKAEPSTRGIPVFALTASAFTNDEKKILAAGFDGFLAKPFKKSSLFALIRDRSGIELEYEKAPEPKPAQEADPSAIDWTAAAKAIGSERLARLEEYVLINDFTAVGVLAKETAKELPGLSALLARYAAGYDESGLGTAVSNLKIEQ